MMIYDKQLKKAIIDRGGLSEKCKICCKNMYHSKRDHWHCSCKDIEGVNITQSFQWIKDRICVKCGAGIPALNKRFIGLRNPHFISACDKYCDNIYCVDCIDYCAEIAYSLDLRNSPDLSEDEKKLAEYRNTTAFGFYYCWLDCPDLYNLTMNQLENLRLSIIEPAERKMTIAFNAVANGGDPKKGWMSHGQG